jgi:hypothetical protein
LTIELKRAKGGQFMFNRKGAMAFSGRCSSQKGLRERPRPAGKNCLKKCFCLFGAADSGDALLGGGQGDKSALRPVADSPGRLQCDGKLPAG